MRNSNKIREVLLTNLLAQGVNHENARGVTSGLLGRFTTFGWPTRVKPVKKVMRQVGKALIKTSKDL